MILTILLAKIFGLYMLAIGVSILMNRRQMMLAVVALMKDRAVQLMGGVIALLLGLFLVNIHNDWSTLPAVLVSLVGWAALVKGLVYLFLPEAKLAKLVHALTERSWYMIDGVLAVIIGLYLAGFGFGWF